MQPRREFIGIHGHEADEIEPIPLGFDIAHPDTRRGAKTQSSAPDCASDDTWLHLTTPECTPLTDVAWPHGDLT